MRWWVTTALLAAGCFGGQTGEITQLAACHEAVGTVEVGDASEAGRSVDEQLATITTATEAAIAWPDRSTTTISVSFAPTGAPATLLGGERCVRPWIDAPVAITLRTADGALDETIEGSVLLADMDAATGGGSIVLEDLNGALAVDDVDPSRARLRVHLRADPGELAGDLAIDPGEEGAPERALASF